MDAKQLTQLAIRAIKTAVEFHDKIDGTLTAAHEELIANEVARLYHLHHRAGDPNLGLLEIAYDAAVSLVEVLNGEESDPECYIQERWMYHVVQSLLSNSLVPALVEAAVPRIDDDGDMLDEPIDSEVLGEGAAEQSGEESADNDGEDGPRTPEPGTSGRDKSSQVASPQPESPPGEAPQENDNAIKSGPWTDDEIREMIRKRVEGWKHPRVAVHLRRSLSSVQQQWRRAIAQPVWAAFEAQCRASQNDED